MRDAGPVNVLMVAPKPPPVGGIATWLETVLDYQKTHPEVLTIRVVDSSPATQYGFQHVGWRRARGGLTATARVLGGVREGLRGLPRPIVHLTSSGGLGMFRDAAVIQLARLWKVPVVYHLHHGRLPQMWGDGGWQRHIASHVLTRSAAVIVIDPASAAVVRQHYPSVRVLEVPNPIDLEDMPDGNPRVNPRTVVFVGSVRARKGIRELLAAWALVRQPGWSLVLLGGLAPDVADVLSLARQDPTVEVMGQRDRQETLEVMGMASIAVLPSHTEGFPMVVLEAMAMGLPVIASRVGALPDAIGDGGLIVAPRDVDGLAAALTALMADNPARSRMGAVNQQRVADLYASGVVIPQLIECWRGTI